MKNYLILYTLHKARDYSHLYNALNASRAVPLDPSTWGITTTADAHAIRDSLRGCVDGDDTIIVIEVPAGSHWASRNAPAPVIAWLSGNIARAA